MLAILPDRINNYKSTSTIGDMPGSFTYFAYGANQTHSMFSRSSGAKYNIWHNPIFNVLHYETSNTSDYSDSPLSNPEISTGSPTLSNDESSPVSNDDNLFPVSDNDGSLRTSCICSDEVCLCVSDDSGSDNIDSPLPSMEQIVAYKRLDLTPSCFLNGCVCGHHFEFRDMAYESRKRRNGRPSGVTIIPKTLPISAKLRCTRD